jgi:hypothetical protein
MIQLNLKQELPVLDNPVERYSIRRQLRCLNEVITCERSEIATPILGNLTYTPKLYFLINQQCGLQC